MLHKLSYLQLYTSERKAICALAKLAPPQVCAQSTGHRIYVDVAQLNASCHAGITGCSKARLTLLEGVPGGTPLVRVALPSARRKYAAGQRVLLCVPRAGLLHWRPVAVSSGPHDSELLLHIGCEGRWAQRVAQMARTTDIVKVRSAGTVRQ